MTTLDPQHYLNSMCEDRTLLAAFQPVEPVQETETPPPTDEGE